MYGSGPKNRSSGNQRYGSAMRKFVSLGLVAPIAFTVILASALYGRAETKIFFVENQPDGYGIDQCLASGAKCGKPMASAYCQSRQYGEAVSFRKVEPEELPADKAGSDATCRASGCVDFVAIECER
jgi:hypothetical protein